MSDKKRYLVRKLAITFSDGQFHDYALKYVSAEEICGMLGNLVITAFEREQAAATFLDSLELREESEGLFKVVGI